MSKNKKKFHFPKIKRNILPIILTIILFVLILITYQVMMIDRYYPLTFVGDTNISFLTEGQAIRKVQNVFQLRSQQKLIFEYPQAKFTIDIATSSASLAYSDLDLNFYQQRKSSFWENIQKQIQTLLSSVEIHPKITVSLDEQLDTIASSVEKPPKNAQLLFDETPSEESSISARIQIKDGEDGLALDKPLVKNAVTSFLLTGKYRSNLPLKIIPPRVTTNQVIRAKQILEQLKGEPIKLIFENNSWTIDTKQLLTLLDLESGQNLLLDKAKTQSYLSKIASEVDQDVREGLFDFNPQTKRVTTFKPSQEGRRLDKDKAYLLITDTLTNLSTTGQTQIQLPVNIIKPKIETSDVNTLGIKELLGTGVSNFAGSIPNRIYNVNLTASKINGILVPPGEVFSFNQTIGDISAATGFKQAYVIKEGRTVLDDGGGVCQDSTTLFRAVLNAGLPVIKRTAHAYRVGYYEQGFPPGLDATVFYPSVDFQFKNDTEHYILIQAYTNGNTLYVDLYGTSDGRSVALTTPVVTDITPAPPDLRQDDPTLPRGVVKQVDFAARGADVSFQRTVIKNGEVIAKEIWKSFYKPWQAVYLVGTQ